MRGIYKKNKREISGLEIREYVIKFSAFFVIIIIGSFLFFRLQKVTSGPIISIETPKMWESVDENLVEFSGTAKNISKIKMDGRKIFVDEENKFKEELLLYPGYNIIKIEAWDRFGEKAEEKIKIYRK